MQSHTRLEDEQKLWENTESIVLMHLLTLKTERLKRREIISSPLCKGVEVSRNRQNKSQTVLGTGETESTLPQTQGSHRHHLPCQSSRKEVSNIFAARKKENIKQKFIDKQTRSNELLSGDHWH